MVTGSKQIPHQFTVENDDYHMHLLYRSRVVFGLALVDLRAPLGLLPRVVASSLRGSPRKPGRGYR